MELLTGVMAAFGLSASAGLNAYIPLLVIGLVARYTNLIELGSPWDTLTSWWVLGLLIVLSVVEFFADKFPAVNHINYLIQTIIRPVAGAIVFAASAKVITDIHPVLALAAVPRRWGAVVKAVAIRPAAMSPLRWAHSQWQKTYWRQFYPLFQLYSNGPYFHIYLITAWLVYFLWRRANRDRLRPA
jgi:hypothetical protein